LALQPVVFDGVGMEDRRTVRGMLVCGVSIELVIEDGADRAVEALDGSGEKRIPYPRPN